MPAVAQTLDLPPAERFEYWKHVLSDAFVPLEVCCPAGEADFHGWLHGCELGALRFVEVVAEPHIARRTPRLIRSAPAGCYKVGLQLRGTSVLIQDGREATLCPGDFSLYDTDRPYTLAFSDSHRMLVLVFPRDVIDLPPGKLAGLTATRIRGGTATLIGPFLSQLADLLAEERAGQPSAGLPSAGLHGVDSAGLHGVGTPAGVRLAGNVLDLFGTVLADRLDCAPPDPDAAHRAQMLRITSFIEEHLAEADLSPAQIAAAHHVSLRQLHKLFHASGTTVASWIRQRRLEHCAHDLRTAARPVSAVGARWGYPDPAHFSRLFKVAYGVSPRDFRGAGGVLPRTSTVR
jgi:AraC-like DNA-binding protein